MFESIRNRLRNYLLWIQFQELNREGWYQALRRNQIQNAILKTPPIKTQKTGDIEVRVLTWRRDWLNAIWALKSFYHYSSVNYPLYLHDGGLETYQRRELLAHFPNATLVQRADADAQVEALLNKNNWNRTLLYRRLNVSTLKVFDFFLLSQAKSIISIDSDIVFFKNPLELLQPAHERKINLFNEDLGYAYSMELNELESSFGIRPIPLINSGLSMIARESMDFEKIEKWLQNPKLFQDHWVTEQTLHALCSSLYGVELLPSTYKVSTTPGLTPDLVCKHYPGFFRPLLYREGMQFLLEQSDFLKVKA